MNLEFGVQPKISFQFGENWQETVPNTNYLPDPPA